MTRYMTIQETMKLTGKSRRTLYRDMKNGILNYYRNNRDQRICEEEHVLTTYSNIPSCSSHGLKGNPSKSRNESGWALLDNQSKAELVNSILSVSKAGVPLEFILKNIDISNAELHDYLSQHGDMNDLLKMKIKLLKKSIQI